MTTPSHLRIRVATWALIALWFLSWVRAATSQNGQAAEIDLQQNWSDDEKADFWPTSQGSRLLPYSLLQRAPGVVVTDAPNPLSATGRDPVFVGRVRRLDR